MTEQHDLARIARAVIDANSYLTLATADRAGQPRPSPLCYAHQLYQEFFWVSSPSAQHSRNLANGPRLVPSFSTPTCQPEPRRRST